MCHLQTGRASWELNDFYVKRALLILNSKQTIYAHTEIYKASRSLFQTGSLSLSFLHVCLRPAYGTIWGVYSGYSVDKLN